MSETNHRIDWVDMARGYGILLVIIGHLAYETQFARWIYSFHMPLFFFLSGFVFVAKGNFIEFLKKKSKAILVPYFGLGMCIIVFEIIYYPLRGDYHFSFSKVFYKIKDLLIQKRAWALWFLACLFLLEIIFYIIVKVFKNIWFIGIVCLAMSIGGYHYYQNDGVGLVWNIDVCLIAIIFFYIGYLSKYLSERYVNKVLQNPTRLIVGAVLIILLVAGNIALARASYASCGRNVDLYFGSLGNPLFSFPSAIFGILAVIVLSKLHIFESIRYFGEHSLVYYALHQSIMIPLSESFLQFLGFESPDLRNGEYWLYFIAQFFILIVALTVCCVVLNKTKLGVLIGNYGKIHEKSH